MTREEANVIYGLVLQEMRRQDERWGEDRNLKDGLWYLILGEEFGEVGQAALHDKFGGSHAGTLIIELVQTIAVAFQWIRDLKYGRYNVEE